MTSELLNDECNLHDYFYLPTPKTIMTCDHRSDNNMVAQFQPISQLLEQPKPIYTNYNIKTSSDRTLNKNDNSYLIILFLMAIIQQFWNEGTYTSPPAAIIQNSVTQYYLYNAVNIYVEAKSLFNSFQKPNPILLHIL